MSGDHLPDLQQEHEYCERAMITSGTAAQELIVYAQKATDPFKPDAPASDNAWIGGGKATGVANCAIL